MPTNNLPLDQKSIARLATKGLAPELLKKHLNEDIDLSLELWHAQGLEIVKHDGNYFFQTRFLNIQEATFCIVDIETNGSKIEKHQIIEIAALKLKNGVVVDSFDSLVYCNSINEHISQITGIKAQDTKDAPHLKEVLNKFRLFLGDAVFVAHDVKFDYKFISQSMQKVGLPPLLNRTLCSLAFAERTLISYRYALSYLNETFHLHPHATHHRAMSDVITTLELFKLSLKNVDNSIKTVEDLIRFTHEAKRLKRPAFDPLKIVEQTS